MTAVAAAMLALALVVPQDPPNAPLFRFGIVADAQYADKPGGTRRYREAAGKLAEALRAIDGTRPAFVLQLGDIIDGNGDRSLAELKQMTAICERARTPVRHVVGNHCLTVGRPTLMRALRLASPWYEFRRAGWRFIVLDGMDVSEGHSTDAANAAAAARYLAAMPRPPAYNGAIGARQLAWLKSRLDDARSWGDRVVLACHHPITAEPGDISHTLWNGPEIQRLLVEAGCVAAVLSGHDHRGAYALREGIHHLTAPAICDAPAGGNAFAVVDVHADRLEVHGFGTFPSRTLHIPAR